MSTVESGKDLSHYHHPERSRPGLIELRTLDADDRPGELHGTVFRSSKETWSWTCVRCSTRLCSTHSPAYDSDGDAWAAFLRHEEDAHPAPLAVIVSLDEHRTTKSITHG